MFCTNCGEKISFDTKFCPNCGTASVSNDAPIKYTPNKIAKSKVIDHLEIAKIFETRIFTLDNMINKLEERIQELRTPLPQRKKYTDYYDFLGFGVFGIIFLITLLIFVFTSSSPFECLIIIISIVLIFFSDVVAPMVFASLGISLGIYLVINSIFWIKTFIDNRRYSLEYKFNVASDKKDYEENLRIADKLEKEQKKLKLKKKEAKLYLSEIYKADIIAPKYRTMTAVLTIYEYFVYERCESLTGHEGAYNLYESELRMGIIINSLSEIMTKLDAIQQNQYMIYNAIKETQSMMDSLSYSMQNMSSDINSISNNSQISSYYSKMSAENTKALTYINLLSQ